ncbi:MAG: oxidoreductase, partial [Thermoleophilia bacterium]|nr:oxidoreductase [Thermoleophilia bacterium]
MSPRRATLWAAAVGLAAAAAVVAVTELVALLIAPASSSVLAVGSLVIDLAPPWLKDVTIALFGEADKIVLLVMVGLLVAVLAVIVGVLEYRRRPWGAALLGLVGVVALVAVLTRAEATAFWAIPTLLGVVTGIVALRWLMALLGRWGL